MLSYAHVIKREQTMFFWLVGKQKRKVHCTNCTVDFHVIIRRSVARKPYLHDHRYSQIFQTDCPLCCTPQTLVEDEYGNLSIRDPDWDGLVHGYHDRLAELETTIATKQQIVEEQSGTDNELKTTRQVLTTVMEELLHLNSEFDQQQRRHDRRQEVWSRKVAVHQ